ncbi:MAG: M28 family metallopeptidase [Akkermansia sp.]|nr:M28 family metallopeptidase [Akkermansia sp.]
MSAEARPTLCPCPASPRGNVFAALLLGLAALCSCEDKPAPPPAPVQQEQPAAFTDAPSFSGDNAYLHTAALCELGPRPSGSEAYARQLGYLETRLTAAGWQVARDSFSAPNGVPMCNLRARFGEGNHTRPVLVSCHIDTKRLPGFIGADDGASGAGAMLELARVLTAQHPQLAEQVEFIFLDGEESFGAHMTEQDGLYGSRHDVARRSAARELPRYQINLDMVGGADCAIAVPAYDTSDKMLAQYAKAILAENLSDSRWTVVPASYRDDHRPYLEAGVDALNLIADFRGSTWWHKSGDTMARISSRPLSETGRLCLRLLAQLLRN